MKSVFLKLFLLFISFSSVAFADGPGPFATCPIFGPPPVYVTPAFKTICGMRAKSEEEYQRLAAAAILALFPNIEINLIARQAGESDHGPSRAFHPSDIWVVFYKNAGGYWSNSVKFNLYAGAVDLVTKTNRDGFGETRKQ